MYPDSSALEAYAKGILTDAKLEATNEKITEVVDDLEAAVTLAIVESLPEELAMEFDRWAERDDATESELADLFNRSGLDIQLISRKAMLRYRDELIKGAKANTEESAKANTEESAKANTEESAQANTEEVTHA